MVLSDQINYLGANNATTAAEIAQVVNDSAALGQIAGMSADSTAALATSIGRPVACQLVADKPVGVGQSFNVLHHVAHLAFKILGGVRAFCECGDGPGSQRTHCRKPHGAHLGKCGGQAAHITLDLSTQIPMTAEELTQLAAAAGQSGKGISDLIQTDAAGNIGGFLKDVAMMGTAMDISAEQAGDWAAKWEHSFNMTHDQVMVLSDQINYLGANNATTARPGLPTVRTVFSGPPPACRRPCCR